MTNSIIKNHTISTIGDKPLDYPQSIKPLVAPKLKTFGTKPFNQELLDKIFKNDIREIKTMNTYPTQSAELAHNRGIKRAEAYLRYKSLNPIRRALIGFARRILTLREGK